MGCGETGNLLAAGDKNGLVRIWKRGRSDPYREYRIKNRQVMSLDLSTDTGRLAVGSDMGDVHVFNIEDNKEYILELFRGVAVVGLAFTEDMDLLVVCLADARTVILKMSTGSIVRKFCGYTNPSGISEIVVHAGLMLVSSSSEVCVYCKGQATVTAWAPFPNAAHAQFAKGSWALATASGVQFISMENR